jgi:DNA-directed RNA polymerase specialized sigma24 family protein
VLATLADLNAEWGVLVRSSDATVAAWAGRFSALDPAPDLAGLLDAIRDRPDAAMAALLAIGREGEPLAWRVVLQAMLGTVVLACRRRPDRFDEAVSELWLAIAEYPLERRPRSIATNLTWTLRRRLAEPALAPVALPPVPQDASAEATLTTARRLRLIDADTHRTLWLVYVAGLTSARAAEELGTTPELVRYRCSRSLRRLARHADLLSA